mgnify:CR=1 FL=1
MLFRSHEGSRGKATLFGSQMTVAPSRAALANGTATHGFELDDIIQGALVHPGACVVPAALAVAEETNAPGERLLLAIIAGYEMMSRLGWALGAEHNTRGLGGAAGKAVNGNSNITWIATGTRQGTIA